MSHQGTRHVCLLGLERPSNTAQPFDLSTPAGSFLPAVMDGLSVQIWCVFKGLQHLPPLFPLRAPLLPHQTQTASDSNNEIVTRIRFRPKKKKKSFLHSAISQFVVILWELWNRQCCWNPIKFMFLSDSTYMIWLASLQFLPGKHHDCSQPSCPRRQFGCRVTSQVSEWSSTLVFFITRCSAFAIASV